MSLRKCFANAVNIDLVQMALLVKVLACGVASHGYTSRGGVRSQSPLRLSTIHFSMSWRHALIRVMRIGTADAKEVVVVLQQCALAVGVCVWLVRSVLVERWERKQDRVKLEDDTQVANS
jgi:hypothetical protein